LKEGVRLLALSDIHGRLGNIGLLGGVVDRSKPDAIVVSGDLTHFGSLADASVILSALTRYGAPVLFVPGNCDPAELASSATIEGASNIHGRCLRLLDLSFIGVGGGVPSPFKTPFELTEAKIGQILLSASSGCIEHGRAVVVSHAAPYGPRVDRAHLGKHLGSRSLRKFIDEHRPAASICGHIHEGRGVDVIGGTTVVNPGPFRDRLYALIEVEDSVNVSLEAL
jgi:Icc-related predicted phosphoesterase